MKTVSQEKIDGGKNALTVFLPDTRGVSISRFGKGNLKIGPNVVTYSKVAEECCPGATDWCKAECYAKRIGDPVARIHRENSQAGADVPDLPTGTTICRPHVSGDFDSVGYIERWIQIVSLNPSVTFWAYTRSWRVPELLPALERLRALPNMQLLASVDPTSELPPFHWRYAWIEGDVRIDQAPGHSSLICPEERKRVANCEACGFCFRRFKNIRDVVFLRH